MSTDDVTYLWERMKADSKEQMINNKRVTAATTTTTTTTTNNNKNVKEIKVSSSSIQSQDPMLTKLLAKQTITLSLNDNQNDINESTNSRFELLKSLLNNIHNDKETFIQSIQREINMLSDERINIRKTSFITLKDLLCNFKSVDKVSNDNMNHVLQLILKPVLKRFADSNEKCRECAILLVNEYVIRSLDIFPSLVYILPVLSMRITDNFMANENSEEIRYLIAVLLESIVVSISNNNTSENHPFSVYFDTFISLIFPLFSDNFDIVLVKICNAVTILSSIKGLSEFLKKFSISILNLVVVLLNKKHSKVKIAALECMKKLIYHGGAEFIRELTGFREANVIPIKAFYEGDSRVNYFGKMTTDENVQVRGAFYSMISTWWKDLPERFDYETLLMPYLLSGLNDDCSSVQDDVLYALDCIGQQYELDHALKLREELLYAARAESILPQFDSKLPCILFKPFNNRPRVGTRLVVSPIFPRLLPSLVQELNDWRNNLKLLSLNLLRSMLIFVEEKSTQHVNILLPTLSKIMQKCFDSHIFLKINDSLLNDPFHSKVDLFTPISSCLAIIGRYVHPDVLFPLILPSINSTIVNDFVFSGQSPATQTVIDGANSLYAISPLCRLQFILMFVKNAPIIWLFKYLDGIIDLFYIDEYHTFYCTRQLSLSISILNLLITFHSSQLAKPQIIKLFCLIVRFGGFNIHLLNNYSLKDCDWRIIGINRQFLLDKDPLLFTTIHSTKEEFENLSILILSNIKCLVELSTKENFQSGLSKLVTYFISTIDAGLNNLDSLGLYFSCILMTENVNMNFISDIKAIIIDNNLSDRSKYFVLKSLILLYKFDPLNFQEMLCFLCISNLESIICCINSAETNPEIDIMYLIGIAGLFILSNLNNSEIEDRFVKLVDKWCEIEPSIVVRKKILSKCLTSLEFVSNDSKSRIIKLIKGRCYDSNEDICSLALNALEKV